MAKRSKTDAEAQDVADDAQARLDEIRHQGGMPLLGEEIARRRGEEINPPPPLDWRMTPRNVILQLLAIALFVAVIWFLISFTAGNLQAIFG